MAQWLRASCSSIGPELIPAPHMVAYITLVPIDPARLLASMGRYYTAIYVAKTPIYLSLKYTNKCTFKR